MKVLPSVPYGPEKLVKEWRYEYKTVYRDMSIAFNTIKQSGWWVFAQIVNYVETQKLQRFANALINAEGYFNALMDEISDRGLV